MNRRLLLGGLVAIAALVGLLFFWPQIMKYTTGAGEHTAADHQATSVNPPAFESTSRRNLGAPSSVTDSTLPPLDARLADIYSALKAKADAGDAPAACRLGYELHRCHVYPYLAAVVKSADAGRVDANQARLAERLRPRISVDSKVCADFPPEKTKSAWEYTYAAADAGYGPAIINFTLGKVGLDRMHPAETAEGWVAYKQFGPALLQRAIDQGEPQAYAGVAAMSSWKNPVGGESLVPYDPLRAVTLYKALRAVASDPYKQQLDGAISSVIDEAKLAPADIAKADTDAAPLSAKLAQRNTGPIDLLNTDDAATLCARR